MINNGQETLANNLATQRHGSKLRVLIIASDVLFPHFFGENELVRLGEVAEWSRYAQREDSAKLLTEIEQADVLMTTWHSPFLRMEMFGVQPRVRLIAHCGGEVKSRVEDQVFDHIMVTNAAEPMAAPVAEMAMAMMLSLVRRIPDYDSEMRSGMIRTNEYVSRGETICGRKVGVIGFGRIGKAFARLLQPFGAQLLVSDPRCDDDAVKPYGGALLELDELLRQCSVVVLAAGLTPESRHLLDQRRLSLMPDGSYLINVARGGLIDMEALLPELRARRLSAALDVTDPLEPLPPEHELRQMPNVLLTPHIAAGGIEMRREIGSVAVGEVVHFCKGEPLQNVVTREMLLTMT